MGIEITKAIRDKLENGEPVKAEYMIGENVVCLFFKPQSGQRISVRGYIAQQSPKVRIVGIGDKSAKADSISVLPFVTRSVCNRLLAAYSNLSKGDNPTRFEATGSFAEKVLEIPDVMSPDNYNRYTRRGWGKSTTKQAVMYYAHTIGKFYSAYGIDAGSAEFQDFLEKEINRIYDAQYQRPCKDGAVIRQRREQIYNGLMTRWMQARIVQRYLLDHHPELGWPEYLIPISSKYTAVRMEEIKALSYQQYITYLTLLHRLCRAGNPYAFAAVGGGYCGMRIAESCAPLMGDFEILDDIGRYYVDWQIDGDGARTKKLKNKQSHRYTFFGSGFCGLIDLRISQLIAQGVSENEMDLIPFASTAEDPYSFLRPNKVSAFVRSLLELSGCDEIWLGAQAEKMFVAAKVAGNDEDLDIGAHLLRRALATFWSNGGMSNNHVNAMLGHLDDENKHIDYASDDMARQIVAEIQRSLYIGTLAKTHGPAWDAQVVNDNANYYMMGNTMYRFKVEEDMLLDLSATSLEALDEIEIMIPDTCEVDAIICRSDRDTLDSRRNRPILPKQPDAAEVDRWIADAMMINLDEVIKKYH